MKASVLKGFGVSILILLAVGLSISSVFRYFLMDPAASNAILVEQGMEMYDFHHQPWNLFLFSHIITASIALMIGPFQFFKKIRNKRIQLHRNLGKLYVFSILFSAMTGFYLSFYAFGGVLTKLGFFALSVAWLLTTYLAYKHIRMRRIQQHERWMYRSYAVTFVAVTFRFWSAAIGISFDNFVLGYQAAIWVSLIGNIAVMEYWLRRDSNKNRRLDIVDGNAAMSK